MHLFLELFRLDRMMTFQRLPDATFALQAVESEFVPVNPAIHGPMCALVATLSFSRSVQKARWDRSRQPTPTNNQLPAIVRFIRSISGQVQGAQPTGAETVWRSAIAPSSTNYRDQCVR
jgi:hypothetical protein